MSDLLPPLCKGITLASLNRVGNLPCCRDLLIILVNIGDIMNFSSFNIFTGMLFLLLLTKKF